MLYTTKIFWICSDERRHTHVGAVRHIGDDPCRSNRRHYKEDRPLFVIKRVSCFLFGVFDIYARVVVTKGGGVYRVQAGSGGGVGRRYIMSDFWPNNMWLMCSSKYYAFEK